MKTIHKLVAAVSLVLTAGNASADFTSPYGPLAVQPSSILFEAVDENTSSANYGATFVYDLALGDAGLNYASFLNGTQGTNGNLSWNLSNNAAFSPFAADAGQLQWTVLGGESLTNTQTNASTFGLLTTETGTSASFSTSVTPLEQEVFTGNVAVYFARVNAQLDTPTPAASNVASFPSSWGAANNISGLGALQLDQSSIFANLGGLASSGVTSNTIAFWLLENSNLNTRSGRTSPNVVTDIGNFTLTGSTLSYSSASASAVPLPAGVWMFLSGLVGMLGLKRRQQQAVAAI